MRLVCDINYTKISNDLLEKLSKIRIPGEAVQLLFFIMRKTWGWGKEEDWIPLSQIMETGLLKTHIIRCRKRLEQMGIITVTQKGNGECVYRINKDSSCWHPLPKKVTAITKKGNGDDKSLENNGLSSPSEPLPNLVTLPNRVISITQFGNAALPNLVPSKETVSKETVSKEKNICPKKQKPQKIFSDEVVSLTEHLIAKILTLHPNNRLAKTIDKARIQWPDFVEKLIRLDGRSPPEIREMIDWIFQHNFWSTVILSAQNLRENWDKIAAQKGRKLANATHSVGYKTSGATATPESSWEARTQVLRDFVAARKIERESLLPSVCDPPGQIQSPSDGAGGGDFELPAPVGSHPGAVTIGGSEVLQDSQGDLPKH